MMFQKKVPAMSRKLMTVLLSSALILGSVSTSAWSATNVAVGKQESASIQTVNPVKNQAPLPPAGAAGINQAQGLSDYPLFAIALVVGLIGLWILLDDDGDDEAPSTTGP